MGVFFFLPLYLKNISDKEEGLKNNDFTFPPLENISSEEDHLLLGEKEKENKENIQNKDASKDFLVGIYPTTIENIRDLQTILDASFFLPEEKGDFYSRYFFYEEDNFLIEVRREIENTFLYIGLKERPFWKARVEAELHIARFLGWERADLCGMPVYVEIISNEDFLERENLGFEYCGANTLDEGE
jgi:hypothetical protein